MKNDLTIMFVTMVIWVLLHFFAVSMAITLLSATNTIAFYSGVAIFLSLIPINFFFFVKGKK